MTRSGRAVLVIEVEVLADLVEDALDDLVDDRVLPRRVGVLVRPSPAVRGGLRKLPRLFAEAADHGGKKEGLKALLQSVIDVIDWREDPADRKRGEALIQLFELPDTFWKKEQPNAPVLGGSLGCPGWLPESFGTRTWTFRRRFEPSDQVRLDRDGRVPCTGRQCTQRRLLGSPPSRQQRSPRFGVSRAAVSQALHRLRTGKWRSHC